MEEKLQDPSGFQLGDKIRVRAGPYKGARGIIQAESNGLLEIQLNSSSVICTELDKITNYSLAARRAWQVMPKRSGRPQLAIPRKKMVSLRIDVDLWDQLSNAVEMGLIANREEAVNTWLRERLKSLFDEQPLQNIVHE